MMIAIDALTGRKPKLRHAVTSIDVGHLSLTMLQSELLDIIKRASIHAGG
jgi:hypothetical protein